MTATAITIKTAGIINEYSGRDDLAERFEQMARNEMISASKAKSQKEVRFHEGKASAYKTTAEMIRNSDI